MSDRHLKPHAKRHAQGFSMLEVLITIVVLSIGLLGLAALQTSAVQNNQSANFRTQAAILATMIVDRMRANPAGWRSGAYFVPANSVSAITCDKKNPRADSDTNFTGGATAANDLALWKYKVACALPGGSVGIAFPGGSATVSIQWNDARWSGSATTPFTLTTTL